MAASSRPKSSLKVNQECPPNREINILLLGQTGIGKTTFINSFANYLVHDTLDDAINGEMKVIIPTSFSFTDPETFEEQSIQIGGENNHGKTTENGQSCTQQCQSFVFPVGDRNLRLIDTPGMGDTRGSEQDNKNLFEILTYISHYEHLNGICIFLKPNEERLTISFRLCIKQILHYLHKGVRENMIFIFTSARSTFFRPGSSKKLLQVLLNEQCGQDDLEIPFSKENTFLLDNESFRCLALRKNRIQVNDEQMENYKDSWHHTVGEYQRLMNYISTRELHAIANTLSLNEAEQLIRKLSRPIAETLRLIQQNIQLAKDFKQDVQNHRNTSYGLFQYIAQILPLQKPRLVCVNKQCSGMQNIGNEKKKISYRVCREKSYLTGVIQEAIGDSRIGQCEIFDNQTGRPLNFTKRSFFMPKSKIEHCQKFEQ
jgi:GTPase SAR1 family protein